MSRPAAEVALAATEQALSGIDDELERRAVGQGRVSSPEQLTEIRGTLRHMAEQLSASKLPPREQRLRGVSRVIADSWPHDSPLGAMILESEQLYLKA